MLSIENQTKIEAKQKLGNKDFQSWKQSYELNLVLKKTKLVLIILQVHYLNFDQKTMK